MRTRCCDALPATPPPHASSHRPARRPAAGVSTPPATHRQRTLACSAAPAGLRCCAGRCVPRIVDTGARRARGQRTERRAARHAGACVVVVRDACRRPMLLDIYLPQIYATPSEACTDHARVTATGNALRHDRRRAALGCCCAESRCGAAAVGTLEQHRLVRAYMRAWRAARAGRVTHLMLSTADSRRHCARWPPGLRHRRWREIARLDARAR